MPPIVIVAMILLAVVLATKCSAGSAMPAPMKSMLPSLKVRVWPTALEGAALQLQAAARLRIGRGAVDLDGPRQLRVQSVAATKSGPR